MSFNAMPECYNAKKRSNVAYGLGIVYGCLTLAFVIMAVLVNDDVWIFSLLSLPMTVLCIHYSKTMKKDAAITVRFGEKSIEVHDDKDKIIKMIDYNRINSFEDKYLNVAISTSTRSGDVVCKERLILVYFGRVKGFCDLSIGRSKHYDAYYLELFFTEDCIVVPYHDEAMEILQRKTIFD